MVRIMIGAASALLLAVAPAQAGGLQLFPKPAVVTLDGQQPVRTALAKIGQAGGCPVLVDAAVGGQLKLHFKDMPVTQAFLRVALSAGLVWQRQGGAIAVHRPLAKPVGAPTFRL